MSTMGTSLHEDRVINQGPLAILDLYRNEGEKLGMGLRINGDRDSQERVESVFVSSVDSGGPADRAEGGACGLQIGDEILNINGHNIKEKSYSQVLEIFRNLPLHSKVIVARGIAIPADTSEHSDYSGSYGSSVESRESQYETEEYGKVEQSQNSQESLRQDTVDASVTKNEENNQQIVWSNVEQKLIESHNLQEGLEHDTVDALVTKKTEQQKVDMLAKDEPEIDLPVGYEIRVINMDKPLNASLGLSIIHSQTPTLGYFQVRRILANSICSQDGQVVVGDRLVSINEHTMKNIPMMQALELLKHKTEHVKLVVLREIKNKKAIDQNLIAAPEKERAVSEHLSLHSCDEKDQQHSSIKDEVDIVSQSSSIHLTDEDDGDIDDVLMLETECLTDDDNEKEEEEESIYHTPIQNASDISSVSDQLEASIYETPKYNVDSDIVDAPFIDNEALLERNDNSIEDCDDTSKSVDEESANTSRSASPNDDIDLINSSLTVDIPLPPPLPYSVPPQQPSPPMCSIPTSNNTDLLTLKDEPVSADSSTSILSAAHLSLLDHEPPIIVPPPLDEITNPTEPSSLRPPLPPTCPPELPRNPPPDEISDVYPQKPTSLPLKESPPKSPDLKMTFPVKMSPTKAQPGQVHFLPQALTPLRSPPKIGAKSPPTSPKSSPNENEVHPRGRTCLLKLFPKSTVEDRHSTIKPRSVFATSATRLLESKVVSKYKRSEVGPFLIQLLKGFRDLGVKVTNDDSGHVIIKELPPGGAAARDGHIKVGDVLLAVNGKDLSNTITGVDSQEVLNSLPRGTVRLILQSPQCVDKEKILDNSSTVKPKPPPVPPKPVKQKKLGNDQSPGSPKTTSVIKPVIKTTQSTPLSINRNTASVTTPGITDVNYSEINPRHRSDNMADSSAKKYSKKFEKSDSIDSDVTPLTPRLPPDGHEFPDGSLLTDIPDVNSFDIQFTTNPDEKMEILKHQLDYSIPGTLHVGHVSSVGKEPNNNLSAQNIEPPTIFKDTSMKTDSQIPYENETPPKTLLTSTPKTDEEFEGEGECSVMTVQGQASVFGDVVGRRKLPSMPHNKSIRTRNQSPINRHSSLKKQDSTVDSTKDTKSVLPDIQRNKVSAFKQETEGVFYAKPISPPKTFLGGSDTEIDPICADVNIFIEENDKNAYILPPSSSSSPPPPSSLPPPSPPPPPPELEKLFHKHVPNLECIVTKQIDPVEEILHEQVQPVEESFYELSNGGVNESSSVSAELVNGCPLDNSLGSDLLQQSEQEDNNTTFELAPEFNENSDLVLSPGTEKQDLTFDTSESSSMATSINTTVYLTPPTIPPPPIPEFVQTSFSLPVTSLPSDTHWFEKTISSEIDAECDSLKLYDFEISDVPPPLPSTPPSDELEPFMTPSATCVSDNIDSRLVHDNIRDELVPVAVNKSPPTSVSPPPPVVESPSEPEHFSMPLMSPIMHATEPLERKEETPSVKINLSNAGDKLTGLTQDEIAADVSKKQSKILSDSDSTYSSSTSSSTQRTFAPPLRKSGSPLFGKNSPRTAIAAPKLKGLTIPRKSPSTSQSNTLPRTGTPSLFTRNLRESPSPLSRSTKESPSSFYRQPKGSPSDSTKRHSFPIMRYKEFGEETTLNKSESDKKIHDYSKDELVRPPRIPPRVPPRPSSKPGAKDANSSDDAPLKFKKLIDRFEKSPSSDTAINQNSLNPSTAFKNLNAKTVVSRPFVTKLYNENGKTPSLPIVKPNWSSPASENAELTSSYNIVSTPPNEHLKSTCVDELGKPDLVETISDPTSNIDNTTVLSHADEQVEKFEAIVKIFDEVEGEKEEIFEQFVDEPEVTSLTPLEPPPPLPNALPPQIIHLEDNHLNLQKPAEPRDAFYINEESPRVIKDHILKDENQPDFQEEFKSGLVEANSLVIGIDNSSTHIPTVSSELPVDQGAPEPLQFESDTLVPNSVHSSPMEIYTAIPAEVNGSPSLPYLPESEIVQPIESLESPTVDIYIADVIDDDDGSDDDIPPPLPSVHPPPKTLSSSFLDFMTSPATEVATKPIFPSKSMEGNVVGQDIIYHELENDSSKVQEEASAVSEAECVKEYIAIDEAKFVKDKVTAEEFLEDIAADADYVEECTDEAKYRKERVTEAECVKECIATDEAKFVKDIVTEAEFVKKYIATDESKYVKDKVTATEFLKDIAAEAEYVQESIATDEAKYKKELVIEEECVKECIATDGAEFVKDVVTEAEFVKDLITEDKTEHGEQQCNLDGQIPTLINEETKQSEMDTPVSPTTGDDSSLASSPFEQYSLANVTIRKDSKSIVDDSFELKAANNHVTSSIKTPLKSNISTLISTTPLVSPPVTSTTPDSVSSLESDSSMSSISSTTQNYSLPLSPVLVTVANSQTDTRHSPPLDSIQKGKMSSNPISTSEETSIKTSTPLSNNRPWRRTAVSDDGPSFSPKLPYTRHRPLSGHSFGSDTDGIGLEDDKSRSSPKSWRRSFLDSPRSSDNESRLSESSGGSTVLVTTSELAMLIEEANQSIEKMNDDSLIVVTLHKEDESHSLGLTLAGGSDQEVKDISVHRVFPSGLAAKDGRLQPGDRLLSINGKSLDGITHAKSVSHLKTNRSHVVLVVSKKSPLSKVEVKPEPDKSSTFTIVELENGAGGVGFSLEGGQGSLKGDVPITIKKIFQGGVADKCGQLHVGDILVKINGEDVTNKTHFEAWQKLRKLPPGKVTLTIVKQATR
ncbi:uncharacterized protein LOC100370705 [Saccoglossus kowalevskii]